MNTIPLTIAYQGMLLKGYANPIQTIPNSGTPCMTVYIQGWCIGTLRYRNKIWSMDQPIDPQFVTELANYIYEHINSIKKAMNYRQ